MAEPATQDTPEASQSPGDAAPPDAKESELSPLPQHARRLLKIRVPVQVTLASQRKSIEEITELGPGSIVKFNKTCDQPLELLIGGQAVAYGEVVKVGDKFGLRISGLVK
jgi:flagellar motor switch protein FliN